MKKEIPALYHQCRKHKPFMLVGHDAACSLVPAAVALALILWVILALYVFDPIVAWLNR